MATTATTRAPAVDDARRFVWDSDTRTWAIRCDSEICEGRLLEEGFYRLDYALEDTASHDCEAEAEAAYDRRYDMGWSNPA